MSGEEVPHLDVEVDDVKEGAKKIAEVIRPAWKDREIQVEEKSTGYINRNYHCFASTDDDDGIFVRIINTRIPGQLERSINVMRYLKHVKLGAQLLLTFKNGLVMEFIKGEPVTWDCIDKVKEPETWLAYAREMAKYHALTDFEAAIEMKIMTSDERKMKTEMFINASIASGKIPKEHLEGLPTVEEIMKGTDEIYQLLLKFGAEKKFCHSDSNPTNILIKSDKSIVLIDYDDCTMDLACLEMSGAFGSLCGIVDFDISRIPTEEQQEVFIREYLETRRKYEPKRGPVTDKLVQYWQFLLRKSQVYGMLMAIGIFFMLANVSDRPIDLKLCHQFYQMYQMRKDDVLAEEFSWDE